MQSEWKINEMVSFIETRSMGLGVVANCDIPKETTILCDPVRSFAGRDSLLLRQTSAYHYLFVDRRTHSKDNLRPVLHLVVGPISMINHSNKANCRIQWNHQKTLSKSKAALVANRNISAGQELFISYHNIEDYEFN